jgi:hypothetical protein
MSEKIEIGEILFGSDKHNEQLIRCAIGDIEINEVNLVSIKRFLERLLIIQQKPTVTREEIAKFMGELLNILYVDQLEFITKWLKDKLDVEVEDEQK